MLFHDAVFGPIKSRRFGLSLGINLLPAESKLCNYNCVYCECGWTNLREVKGDFYAVEDVIAALEARLIEMKRSDSFPDVISYAGNGEPTMHPHFLELAERVAALRDQFCPQVKIVLLSNATLLGREDVRMALKYIDLPVLKLDAGNDRMLQWLDKPLNKMGIAKLKKMFLSLSCPFYIQTIFVKGKKGEELMDNSDSLEVEQWLALIREIKPQKVMIYTLDRIPPEKGLEKIPVSRMEEIAEEVRKIGIPAEVYP